MSAGGSVGNSDKEVGPSSVSGAGGIGVSTAGGGASFSAQKGHGDGTYANVNEQAGIQAGGGGFDIDVAGNTGLTGAVIASTADVAKNTLTTGTLTFNDIQNNSHYDVNGKGLSAGGSIGNSGKAVGPSSVSGANGTVSATPDVSSLLSQQGDTMQAAQAAGQTVAQGIGAYADKKQRNATTQAEADAWAEGGTNRASLHAAGGALVAGLGGGNANGGAVGAAVSSKLAGNLNALTNSVASDSGSTLLGNIASNVLAGAAGALVGGATGAFAAANADFYNRQLHPDERQWATDHAEDFAAFYERNEDRPISVAEAQKMLLANGFIRVDQAAASGSGFDRRAAQYITENAKGLFSRTNYEYTHPRLYGNADGSLSPEQLALPGAVATPGVGIAAAVAIGAGVVGAPAAAVALKACLQNSVLCANNVANFGAEAIASEAMPAGTGAAVAAATKLGKTVAGDVGLADRAAGRSATNGYAVATEPNTAFFWSGRTDGVGGQDIAAQIAQINNGTTLETLIARNGIKMPAWNAADPKAVQAWQSISAQYAAGASGSVRAVIGSNLRPGNVWETAELPALMNNPKVTQIITIDPVTGTSKTIFTRDK